MGSFKYIPPHEVDARHRAAKPKTSPRELRPAEQRNVEAVLAIGSVRYFTYRNHLFAIPPVPFKLGQKVMSLYIRTLADTKEVIRTGNEEATKSYYRQLESLSRALWSHVKPTGHVRRSLKWMRISRNVFRDASEKELLDITNFFLKGRMMSTVQATETTPEELSTRMSSTNSRSS